MIPSISYGRCSDAIYRLRDYNSNCGDSILAKFNYYLFYGTGNVINLISYTLIQRNCLPANWFYRVCPGELRVQMTRKYEWGWVLIAGMCRPGRQWMKFGVFYRVGGWITIQSMMIQIIIGVAKPMYQLSRSHCRSCPSQWRSLTGAKRPWERQTKLILQNRCEQKSSCFCCRRYSWRTTRRRSTRTMDMRGRTLATP